MDRIKIKDTDLELSRLGLGCVKAGVKWAGQEAFDLFDAFLDMGGNVYDTARVYSDWIPSERGRSERVLGQWLGTQWEAPRYCSGEQRRAPGYDRS